MKIMKKLVMAGLLILPAIQAYAATALVQYNYTKGARDNKGGVNQLRSATLNGHNRMNSSDKNSKTGARVSFRVFRFVNYNDGAKGRNLTTAFNAMTKGTLSGQRKNEKDTKSDLAVVISNAPSAGIRGRAQLPGAYSVVGSRWIQSSTTPHELGHNYNAIHGQGHGMKVKGKQYWTLMRSGVSENSRPSYFSNPSVKFRGVNTSCCGRNNAKRVRDKRNVRANRR